MSQSGSICQDQEYRIPYCGMLSRDEKTVKVSKPKRPVSKGLKDPAGSIAVLHKAFDLLEFLQESEAPKSLDEVVTASQIPRSTAHRLLSDLVLRGYVEKDPAGHYSLGLKLLVLGATVRQRHTLRDISQPFMIALRNQFEETVNLGRLQGESVLYLETVESYHAIRVTGSLGILDPLHATSIGKAILAWLPPTRRPVISNWKRLTPSTICDADEFAAELDRVKKRGYALDDEESMEGGRCVGVPVFQGGIPIAGLSVSGPTARITRESVALMADALKKASSQISEQIKFIPDRLRR